MNKYDVAIVGGGLAGLTAAIKLGQAGLSALVLEKKTFPRHKVCGEYVSNEVLPVLETLGFDPFVHGATRIRRFELSAPSGKGLATKLPLGAFGISRYRFDALLAERAREVGVNVQEHAKVERVAFNKNDFEIESTAGNFSATYVFGAFGKGSNLAPTHTDERQSDRGKYVAVKRHVAMDFPEDLVALHNFAGGYCGVSMVEEGRINVCYLARATDLRDAGDIAQFEAEVLGKNPRLAEVFNRAEPLFERPLAISNFTFGAKKAVDNHVLMAGDSAGMISPLCGNGMAMAIQSGYRLGQIVSEIGANRADRAAVEQTYARFWNGQFSKRLWWGNRLQRILSQPALANTAMSALCLWPGLTPKIIEKTHGQPSLT